MIYYWLHTLYIFIGSRLFWKNVNVLSNLSRTRRVSILDCEGFRFMNNSKYTFYMDLIRFEILFRSKLFDATLKKGIIPTLGSQKIIYKKPLKVFTKFKITLIIDGWDDKWVYHKQMFEQNGKIMAIGYTKVAFWKNKKTLNLTDILADAGVHIKQQKPSLAILNLFNNDYALLHSSNKSQLNISTQVD